MLGFFGVELGGEDVGFLEGGEEGGAVVGGGCDDGIVLRDEVVGVDEVNKRAWGGWSGRF